MEATPDRSAVVIPGRMYGPSAPLLMYAGDAAAARGVRLRRVHWPAEVPRPDADHVGPWVNDQVARVLDEVSGASPGVPPVLIGKSLGTLAATLATDRQLPAVWLTPLLTSFGLVSSVAVDRVVGALRRATAPCLLIGGTRDKLWDGDLARELSPYVLEVPDADHGMYVPGPLANSAAVLGQVVTAVEEFLDQVVWP